jgi:two-component system sensor histidine kinase KdpD
VWVDAEQVDDVVVLSVVDRGPGIPVSHRQQVFEPCQRLGDRSSQAGVGLGLAIARGFTEAMGGELDLDDTPGGGLTVRLRLPVAGEDAAIGRQPAGER